MEGNEPRNSSNVRPMIAGLLLIVGIGLLALSFAWPGRSTRVTPWSTKQALNYQAAAAELHRLSHEFSRTAGTDAAPQVRAELRHAQTEYDVLRAELDSAMARPKRIAMFLRVGGLVLAAAGAVDFFYRRASHAG